MSLLNSISMGFGPMSMGAYRSVAPRGSIASLPQELCVSEDCDDDDVVALERWREELTLNLGDDRGQAAAA